MTAGAILTLGLGTFGSANLLITLGYSHAVPVATDGYILSLRVPNDTRSFQVPNDQRSFRVPNDTRSFKPPRAD